MPTTPTTTQTTLTTQTTQDIVGTIPDSVIQAAVDVVRGTSPGEPVAEAAASLLTAIFVGFANSLGKGVEDSKGRGDSSPVRRLVGDPRYGGLRCGLDQRLLDFDVVAHV